LEDVNMRTIIFLVGGFVVPALAGSHADEAGGTASRRSGVLTGGLHPDRQEVGRVMRTFRTASRTAAALVMMAALGGSVQLASAPPAAAFLELERAYGLSGVRNLDSPKGAQASCPPGKVVVGGGAEIEGGGEDPATQPRVTQLLPLITGFSVTAEAPSHASEELWIVRAYAICADADALASYQTVAGASAKEQENPHGRRKPCRFMQTPHSSKLHNALPR
jgi:hypothetical protein